MNIERPFVSIIIPAYNDAERLKSCLSKLEQQTYPRSLYEVLVVDNNSTDSLELTVSEFQQSKYLFEPNPGSYSARNKGLSVAKGNLLGFTDSDCVPDSDWIERGVTRFLATENCGLVAGKIQLFFKKAEHPTVVELFDSQNFLQQQKYVAEDHYGATANIFTSRVIFDAVGLFNDQLKSGGDREWGQRVHSAGFRQVYADDVCVAHPARHSWPEMSRKITRVIEGRYKIDGKQAEPVQRFLRRTVHQIRPPVRDIYRVFADETIQGWYYKVGVSLIFVFIRYLSLWTEIQIYLKTRLA